MASEEKLERLWERELAIGMSPSPWYDDDPAGDPDSLYWRRVQHTLKVCAKILEAPRRGRLQVEAARVVQHVRDKQLPNSWAALPVVFRRRLGQRADWIMGVSRVPQ